MPGDFSLGKVLPDLCLKLAPWFVMIAEGAAGI